MSEPNVVRPPLWFWLAAVLAVLWNALGIAAYLAEAYGAGQQSETHRALSEARPAWATGAYAIAVFTGTAGGLALLLRRRWAKALFIVSLAALLVQQAWAFLFSDALALLGMSAIIFPALVAFVCVTLVWFAHRCEQLGLLR